MNNILLRGTGRDRHGHGDNYEKTPVSKKKSLNSTNQKLNKTAEFKKISAVSFKEMQQCSNFKTLRLTHEIFRNMCMRGHVIIFTAIRSGRP
jgi:hypothetical protein